MNKAIVDTDNSYSKMIYKEALKTGFFELQLSRDRYRELCFDGMHKKLIYDFIRIQALLLSPICPHVCDYIWTQLLKNVKSVTNPILELVHFLTRLFFPLSLKVLCELDGQ